MPKASNEREYVAATAVLCDEIRKEDNGKLLLIGVYSGDLLVNELPVTLGLSVYVNFFLPAGKSVLAMRLQSSGGTSPEVELTVEGPVAGMLGVPTPRLLITCQDEDVIRFEMEFNKTGDWREICRKRVLRPETFSREAAELANQSDSPSRE